MKKKSVVILLAGAFSISMIGCGGGVTAHSDSVSNSTTEISEGVDDESSSLESSTTESSVDSNKDENEATNVISVDNEKNTDSNAISASSAENEIKPPTVLDYGYVVVEGFDSYYVEYAYEMKNENSMDIQFPTVKITVKDEAGSILASDEDVRGYLSAGDTMAHSSQVSCQSMPASIEIVGVKPDDYNIVTNSAGISSADFEIFNVSLQGDSITGEITNNSEHDYESGFEATAIFRDADGKIVSGATDYYTNMFSAGETTTFEINCMFDPAEYTFDTITVTAHGDVY